MARAPHRFSTKYPEAKGLQVFMQLEDVDLKDRGFEDVNFVSKEILTDNCMTLYLNHLENPVCPHVSIL